MYGRVFNGVVLTILVCFTCLTAGCQNSAPVPAPPGNADQLAGQPALEQPATEQPGPEQPAEPEPTVNEPEQPVTQPPPVAEPEPEPQPEPNPLPPPSGDTPVTLDIPDTWFSNTYSEPACRIASAGFDPLYNLPLSLEGVAHLEKYQLSEPQLAALSTNGFVVTPEGTGEFYQIYEPRWYPNDPLYVTTDALLHSYHLIFNKVLRDLEDQEFYPALVELAGKMSDAAQEQYYLAEGTNLEDQARRAWAYCVVGEVLLTGEQYSLTPEIASLVTQETDLIEAMAGAASSPLLTMTDPVVIDYTQFKPRGHYAKTEQRQRYFKTMMWYGLPHLKLGSNELTQVALLLTRLLNTADPGDTLATDLWAKVYDPTKFLVGHSDDHGFRDYTQVAREVYGDTITLGQIADIELLVQFKTKAAALPTPRIYGVIGAANPFMQPPGFRFMGQRFTLDGYIMSQIMYPHVDGLFLPSGLGVMAALGSDHATVRLGEANAFVHAGYTEQLDRLQSEVSQLQIEDWSENVYSSWLYLLTSVIEPRGSEYPPYMRTDAWADKDLQSALGSWAELKYDTILYSKQPVCGACPPEQTPVVQHQVEPVPATYARMIGLAEMTKAGLAERGLLSEDVDELLTMFTGLVTKLQAYAEKQLAGELLTEDESEHIRAIGFWLYNLLEKSADKTDEYYWGDLEDEPAAIIADVATNPIANQVLEVGTGDVFQLIVVTPDGYGGLQATLGAVYSYYEFPWSSADRMTVEDWRRKVRIGDTPRQPDWTQSFIIE